MPLLIRESKLTKHQNLTKIMYTDYRCPMKLFVYRNSKLLGLGRQFEQINFGAFGVFSADFDLGLRFEFEPQRIWDLANVCPQSVCQGKQAKGKMNDIACLQILAFTNNKRRPSQLGSMVPRNVALSNLLQAKHTEVSVPSVVAFLGFQVPKIFSSCPEIFVNALF